MGNHHWETAQKITAAFRNELNEEARAKISEAQFNELSQMISSAISAELDKTTTQVEALAHKLRATVGKSELEL
jgi:hypothetical protein